ncbi:class IV lanthionine synthetase LanL [Kitasatospora camelliae]|uniref:Class IV lanthionine synthetase LanL n=1 Tax=Kitasatospora camelliae TaxID=3156397 RepID=A0AAU8K7H0_9ACTN
MGADTPLRPAGGPGTVDDGPGLDGTLVEVARAAVAGRRARGGEGGWGVAVEGFWCTVRPPGPGFPEQGWKLHVSAASSVAVEVLAAVSAAISEDPCAFKFAADREKLRELNSRNSERGSSGKFITVYPRDDEQFRRLAEELHRATLGLPGPAVLSDLPYRPGSRVHYRYGSFAGRAELGNDGAYRSMLRGPDGSRAEDVRAGGYRCPPWAVDPVEGRGSTGPGRPSRRPAGGRGGVLLGGRYALTAAVRHGSKGGVFTGRDTDTGAEVVVKQARAHIEVDRSGLDARAALRREAALLERLGPLELTPRPLGLVEEQDSLFLVQERVPGQSLGSWVAGRLRRDGTPDVRWEEAGPMARALVDLLVRVHRQGLVLRDLSPGNVLVRPDGTLRLVDLELAVDEGVIAGSAGTPGYRAPEHTGPHRLGAARHSTDLYALGGLLFLLATGHDPLLPEDLPRARPVEERLGRWLALAARHGETARRLTPAVLGLRHHTPTRRWPLPQVTEALGRDPAHGGTSRPPGEGRTTRIGRVDTAPGTEQPYPVAPDAAPHRGNVTHLRGDRSPGPGRVVDDGLRYVAGTAMAGRRDRLWPTVPAGRLTDPCNVQYGAAGVLAVLSRAATTPALPDALRLRSAETARTAAAWIEHRCAAEPVLLPGLHFGRSGTAWSLLDAAEAVGDRAAAARAVDLARRIEVVWPNPDVCHGSAGAGFLQLRVHASTGDPAFLDRAARCAEGLLAAARREPYGLVWPVPGDFDSALAGAVQLGYAHGVAGVGAFLLAAGTATGRTGFLDGAREAAGTLAATVRRSGPAAWWPQSAGDREAERLAHWCNGSSGAGSFLVRLWRATGDEAAYRLAVAAGRAVLDGRWQGGVSACHGLAGNGEFLLDLHQATGEEQFRRGAEELAELITARAALRDGLWVLPDETGTGCTPAYGTGTTGPLAFLLRLAHGGPRIWVDPQPLPTTAPRHRPGTALAEPPA